MQIRHLHLLARDLAAQRRFYADTLGFVVSADAGHAFTLQTGASQLTFIDERHAGSPHAPYHFAFNIPIDLVDRAARWTAALTPLLPDRTGQLQFRNQTFASHQLYFKDPDGNIGEFIGRERLPLSGQADFTPRADVLAISEIGLAVPDVPTAVMGYMIDLGPSRFGPNPGEAFAAVGDDDGMLIVVRDGRPWFPDTGIPALPLWLEAELESASGRWLLGGPPYRLRR